MAVRTPRRGNPKAAPPAKIHADGKPLEFTLQGDAGLPSSEAEYRLLFERNPNPMWVWDARTFAILAVNDATTQLFGFTEDEFLSMTMLDVRPPDEVARFITRVSAGPFSSTYVGTWRYRKRDGAVFPAEVTTSDIVWQRRPARLSLIRDVTERLETELALVEAEAKLEEAQQLARLGSWDIDLVTDVASWSTEIYDIYGIPLSANPIARAFYEFDHPDDAEPVRRSVEKARDARTSWDIDHRIVRSDGAIRWVHERGEFQYDGAGKPIRAYGTLLDITERKQIEEQLEYLAHYDALTGLPNRTLLKDRLAAAIAGARREQLFAALISIDLDHFKVVNETFGHETGSELLKAIAARLQQSVVEADTIARTSGDEFTIVLAQLSTPFEVSVLGKKILDIFAAPFDVNGKDLHVTCSVGSSVYPIDGNDPDALMRNADTATHEAKNHGRNTYRFFTPEMRTNVVKRMSIQSDLRRAIENDEMVLFYQPLVNVATGKIVGAEALVRWKHPDAGLVAPSHFIPVAEDSGLIVPLGEWVVANACRQAAGWCKLADDFSLSLNVSARQLQERSLAKTIVRAIAAAGFPAGSLELELTESTLMQQQDVAAGMLAELKTDGVRISLDDFGTGYTSFDYIERFGIDTLKIDRFFVNDILGNQHKHAIARAILLLAENLNLRSVAEGIETRAQFYVLRQMGCKIAQGFYFSPPLPAHEFEALMSSGRLLVPA